MWLALEKGRLCQDFFVVIYFLDFFGDLFAFGLAAFLGLAAFFLGLAALLGFAAFLALGFFAFLALGFFAFLAFLAFGFLAFLAFFLFGFLGFLATRVSWLHGILLHGIAFNLIPQQLFCTKAINTRKSRK